VEPHPPSGLEITFAWCEACGHDVLTHAHYDQDDAERLCVHCDGPVASERKVRLADLEAEGYAVIEQQGCGRPDCGGGRCGRS
jgi:hypothetical protein